jgi:glyoxylase-like metal-dependent hydrolase (beta-lactamase superfamily II)
MKNGIGWQLAGAWITMAAAALPVLAVEVVFKPVADGVYAYVGDIEGRTYENEGLNANIGLVVTPAGAVLIDSGATFQSARKIHEAAKKVTTQPIRWVINTGDQDHRWLGNGYFKSLGIETIAHADAEADMKARCRRADGRPEGAQGAARRHRAHVTHALRDRTRTPALNWAAW